MSNPKAPYAYPADAARGPRPLWRALLLSLGASSAIVPAGIALAQNASPAATAQVAAASAADDIIVTGSRIARQGFEAPNPVTVLNSQDVEKLGLTNVASVVSQLPQNAQFTAPTNVGLGNFNIGASLANLRGLNPFFGTRTLTLVNSKRFVPTTDTGAIDLNVVPSVLVSRVETVTGGASAVYGSDAVAGVVNILLDTTLEGFKGQLDYGLTFRGDGRSVHGSAAYGTAFAGGRGHIVLGGEYEKTAAIGGCAQVRDWCRDGAGMFTNGAYLANGQPHYIIGPNARNVSSRTGLFPFLNMQFNDAGTALIPYNAGQYENIFGFPALIQGGADETQGTYVNNALRPRVKHYSLYGHAEYDLTDSVNVYVEGSYYKNDATNVQPEAGASVFSNVIMPDNVFLPDGVTLPGPQPFISDGSLLPEVVNHTTTKTYRGVLGLKADLFADWGLDAYYTYGRSEVHENVANSQVNSLFANALDAVAGPDGTPICRINATPGPLNDPACSPLNLFGLNGGNGWDNSAGAAYAYRLLHQDEIYQQHVVSASVHGDLFQGWGAGPIGFAAGGEYRHEKIVTTHNIENQPYYYDFARNFGAPYHGKMDILEGFAEISVPILKDVPFFKSLSFDGAIRETRNRIDGTSGDIYTGIFPESEANTVEFTTWKLNGIWDVNDWIRFRATRSRDVRAPSFYELYSQNIANGGGFGTVNNPVKGSDPTTNTDSILSRHGGSNAGLRPEKADTWTVGAVLTGHDALSGFQASVDWYQVKLKGPISTLGTQNVVNACYNEGAYCDLLLGTGLVTGVGPNGTGSGYADITEVDDFNQNLGTYTTRGLDLEADYILRLRGDASVSLRVIGSYLYDLVIDTGTGGPVYNYAGVSGPTPAFGYYNTSPKWQGNAFLSYSDKAFTGTIQARYVGPGKFAFLDTTDGGIPYVAPGDPGYDPSLPNSINNNHVKSAIYFNLSASYRIPYGGDDGHTFELFGLINNIFDKKPPVAPGGNGFPTNPVFFDTIGASFKVGVRVRY
ncbi:MAG TPA: TonB-dependent receptor [Sphingomonadaceae bacterium]|nr:TonB-dependent receptor [Sphingomonadaceae bacterium]